MKKLVLGFVLALVILAGAGSAQASINSSLSIGSRGDGVTSLQQFLVAKGFLNTAPTGYFGNLTSLAVSAFQGANGLPQVGQVGPRTLVLLNAQMAGGTMQQSPSVSGCMAGALFNSMTGASCTAPQQQLTSCSGTTPSITVTSPNGGETYVAGQQITVAWTGCNIPSGDLVNVNLMRFDPTTSNYSQHVATTPDASNTVPYANGSALITVSATGVWPTNVQYGNVYKVLLDVIKPSSRDAGALDAQDWSDNSFSINASQQNSCGSSTTPSITVTSPNGGEAFITGQQATVTWTTCNIPATAQLTLSLSATSGSGAHSISSPLTTAALNDGSESVSLSSSTISYLGGAGSSFKVNIALPPTWSGSTITNQGASDWSDNFFTIN